MMHFAGGVRRFVPFSRTTAALKLVRRAGNATFLREFSLLAKGRGGKPGCLLACGMHGNKRFNMNYSAHVNGLGFRGILSEEILIIPRVIASNP